MPLYEGFYNELRETAIAVLHRLSDLIDINTVYIAQSTEDKIIIRHVYNREKVLLDSGYELSYKDSY